MNAAATALFAPLAAALAGWMLSGSPLPMALSIALLVAAMFARPFLRGRSPGGGVGDFGCRLLATVLVGAALLVEMRLFQRGEAFAMRADIPYAFHWGIAALWWAGVDGILRSRTRAAAETEDGTNLVGIVGGLLVLGASAGTVLYDFGPWAVHPVAALPLAFWTVRSLQPGRALRSSLLFGAVPLALAATGIVLSVSAGTDRVRLFLDPLEDGPLDDFETGALASDSSGPLGDDSSRRLPREANVSFQNRILVWVRTHSPDLFRAWSSTPLYLRTSTLAHFDSDEVLSPLRSGLWLYDIDDGEEDHVIRLRPEAVADGRGAQALHTYYLGRDSANHLPLVGSANAIYAAAVYEFADDWYQLSPADGIDRIRYTAVAPAAPIAKIRAADLNEPRVGETFDVYLQMPDSPLAARVAALCRSLDPAEPLGEIRRVLGERTTYSLRFSTPEDSSPMAEFLFGSGKGHCEHYAAATVLMLRALGIPSRVAYGYAGGLADRSQAILAFRDSDFHAWAEVLTPRNEWKVFDTTPRVAAAAQRIPGAKSLPLVDDGHYEDFSEFDPAALVERSFWSYWLADFGYFLSRHFFLVTVCGMLLLAALWRWLGRGDGSAAQAAAGDEGGLGTGSALPAFLVELESLAASAGLRRRPGHTWRELLAQLGAAGAATEGMREAVAYHYATAYGGAPRSESEEERLAAALRQGRAGANAAAED